MTWKKKRLIIRVIFLVVLSLMSCADGFAKEVQPSLNIFIDPTLLALSIDNIRTRVIVESTGVRGHKKFNDRVNFLVEVTNLSKGILTSAVLDVYLPEQNTYIVSNSFKHDFIGGLYPNAKARFEIPTDITYQHDNINRIRLNSLTPSASVHELYGAKTQPLITEEDFQVNESYKMIGTDAIIMLISDYIRSFLICIAVVLFLASAASAIWTTGCLANNEQQVNYKYFFTCVALFASDVVLVSIPQPTGSFIFVLLLLSAGFFAIYRIRHKASNLSTAE